MRVLAGVLSGSGFIGSDVDSYVVLYNNGTLRPEGPDGMTLAGGYVIGKDECDNVCM